MRLLRAAILALVILAACSEPNVLTSGRVVGKEYDDPDEWVTHGSTCIVYDDDGWTCLVAMPTSQRHFDGPHWKVQIEGSHDGKVKREWYEVTDFRYNDLEFDQRVEVQGDDLVPNG
jgi:hypothetical protein